MSKKKAQSNEDRFDKCGPQTGSGPQLWWGEMDMGEVAPSFSTRRIGGSMKVPREVAIAVRRLPPATPIYPGREPGGLRPWVPDHPLG
jgi:hypothetical protein